MIWLLAISILSTIWFTVLNIIDAVDGKEPRVHNVIIMFVSLMGTIISILRL